MSEWDQIADLIERVVAAPDLLDDVVEEVRASIREVSGLEASDVARHTRALLAAATRSIASRRGPTEAELSFVEDLAVTRARQGVPIHAVLSAIHVAERRIWARAKTVAAETGVDPALVLDARELYDDWAQQVRARLLQAHRSAELTGRATDADADAVRRLLQGGSAASLAAAAAGLPATGLHVLVSPHPDRPASPAPSAAPGPGSSPTPVPRSSPSYPACRVGSPRPPDRSASPGRARRRTS